MLRFLSKKTLTCCIIFSCGNALDLSATFLFLIMQRKN
jgi:hypothetical protein